MEIQEWSSRIPVAEWNLKFQDPSIPYTGPIAQDFYAAFRLGEDDRHISTTDLDGIALRSIQALHQKNRELEEKIREVDELRARLETVEKSVRLDIYAS